MPIWFWLALVVIVALLWKANAGSAAPSLPHPELPEEKDGKIGDDPVELLIEDVIDLHAFAPRDVASVVDEYLEEAAKRGFEEVRIIHGRGMGIQRRIVRKLLRTHPRVARFGDAPAERGGWGATLVRLTSYYRGEDF